MEKSKTNSNVSKSDNASKDVKGKQKIVSKPNDHIKKSKIRSKREEKQFFKHKIQQHKSSSKDRIKKTKDQLFLKLL